MKSSQPIIENDSRPSATTVRHFKSDEPTTLVEAFEHFARDRKRPDTLNYKHDGRWLSISSDEVLTQAREIAAGLIELGIQRGDRLAILCESRPEWTLMDAGCLFAGAIDVPIYPTLTPPQVRYILKLWAVVAISNREKFEQMRSPKEAKRSSE